MNIRIFLLFIIILLYCCKNNNSSNDSSNNNIVFNYHPCSYPFSSGLHIISTVNEYNPQKYFLLYLDSIINESKGCACYKPQTTGFNIFYNWNNGKTPEIRIVMNPKIYIADCKKIKGFFNYNNHYFINYGDVEHFNVDIKRKVTIITILPKKMDKINGDYTPYSYWAFYYNNKHLKLYDKIECTK